LSIADLNFEEVDFGRSALKTVVLELRFNPILTISNHAPAEFQDQVRGTFPKLSADRSALMELRVSQGLQGVGEVSTAQSIQPEGLVWRFRTEDDDFVASLAVGSLSLETTAYIDFPDFWTRFRVLLAALQACYQVEHFTRIGLRYVNMFAADEFAGDWRTRFNPLLLGPLTDKAFGEDVKVHVGQFLIAENDWTITVRFGVDAKGDYRLDLDHATLAKIEPSDIEDRVRVFNRRAYQVFRWSLSESMYQEMEPRKRG